uniref:Ricin-like n=1 Tax=Elaeis guineensis var. tenera TaxID=51953 RepID=A0A6I9QB61_ELAGV|nr:ricin-like [Elaeis guineensis]
MIAEAARFTYIELLLVIPSINRGAEGWFYPDRGMIRLLNNWETLSGRIQASQNGTFDAVSLMDIRGREVQVTNVRPIIRYMGIMVHQCYDPNPAPQSYLLLVRGDNTTCSYEETTARISGRDGLCLDVKCQNYDDGNEKILWSCKSNADVNQFWTLKRDGTIRSNDKCMTPGPKHKYMVIQDCVSAGDMAGWELSYNGTIVHRHFGLVLTADSSVEGTQLSIGDNVHASRQSWLPSNNTKPFVTTIVGLGGLCMQANGEEPWLEECVNDKIGQQWAIYPDGTIRPQQDQTNCLARNSTRRILIHYCYPTSTHRWLLRNDGTILNFYQGLVMDVADSDPSLRSIIVSEYTGSPSQQWFIPF